MFLKKSKEKGTPINQRFSYIVKLNMIAFVSWLLNRKKAKKSIAYRVYFQAWGSVFGKVTFWFIGDGVYLFYTMKLFKITSWVSTQHSAGCATSELRNNYIWAESWGCFDADLADYCRFSQIYIKHYLRKPVASAVICVKIVSW